MQNSGMIQRSPHQSGHRTHRAGCRTGSHSFHEKAQGTSGSADSGNSQPETETRRALPGWCRRSTFSSLGDHATRGQSPSQSRLALLSDGLPDSREVHRHDIQLQKCRPATRTVTGWHLAGIRRFHLWSITPQRLLGTLSRSRFIKDQSSC